MDFDFTTETITPDATSILTVGGSGAFELPSGVTISGSLPAGVVAGAMRWNTTVPQLEYNNGTSWIALASNSGNVTSIVAGTNISVSGATGAVTVNVVNAPSFSGQVTSTVSTGTAPFVVASTTQVANLQANYATDLFGGTANQIPYQTGANATSFYSASNYGVQIYGATGVPQSIAGAAGVLQGSASAIPAFTTTPTLTGTNFSGIPNSALVNSSITIGTTNIALGATSTSLAGMTGITFTSGTVTGVANPVNATDVVNYQTLQAYEGGLEWKLEAQAATTGTLTATYSNSAYTLSGVSITGTAGQFACTATSFTMFVGTQITISGTFGGTGSISGYTNPTTYYVVATNGSTTFTLSTTLNGTGVTTTAGTPTGLTYTVLGVGATLTNSGTQAAFAVDGYTANLNDRILVKNQGTQTQNGIYYVSNQGSGSSNWVLTRTLDADTTIFLNNATLFVTNGSANQNSAWTQTTPNPTIGTSNIVFAQFSGAGTYVTSFSAGSTGLTPSSATTGAITLAGTLNLASGGTNASLTASNGQVTYSTSSAMALTTGGSSNNVLQYNSGSAPTWTGAPSVSGANITATTIPNSALVNSSITVTGGTGLGVAGSPVALGGTVTLSNTGVTSNVAGTGISVSGATGAVTISNTGVTSIVAGTNIYLSGATGAVTVTSSKYWAESSTAPVNSPTATVSQAVAIGTGATGNIYGILASANGEFATAGDAQNIQAVMRFITTATGSQELFLDGAGASQRLVLPNNSAWTYFINIVARRTDTTGTYGSWSFQGLIYRDATAATTTISGNSKTTIARIGNISGAGNDPTVTADTTNGSLKITVQGYGAYTIRWVASIDLVQVTN